MLIKCPECDLQVSDKAITCPHCGYPIDKKTVTKSFARSTKRRRLPNGFGQISEIKGKFLRKPFRAMVTTGKTTDGKYIKQILKPEGYFATYNEAYEALMEYNKNPYDLDASMTMQQLYELWFEEYRKNTSKEKQARAAWNYCSAVYNIRVKELRWRHIKGCIEDGTFEYKGEIRHTSPSKKESIKVIFNLMLDYAVENDLVERNVSREAKLPSGITNEIEANKNHHINFTNEEMKTLWENSDLDPFVDIVLYQCYSGWRPQEIGLIKLEDVDLENGIILGGSKTLAGINRKVPIHHKVRYVVEKFYEDAVSKHSEYLFNTEKENAKKKGDYKMTYEKYRYRFDAMKDRLKLNPIHTGHDCRVQFTTMAKNAKMDQFAIKRIIGHKITDITESVYTVRPDSWLIEEIEKIK